MLFNPLSNNRTVGFVLGILRNALAHGNIFVNSNDESKQIETIIFVARNRIDKDINCPHCGKVANKVPDYPYCRLLAITPDKFAVFLMNWLKFLDSISPEVLQR